MANTATVYARIDPELKSDVEEILASLGVTPSSAVQMFYSQIRLNRGIPFEIKLPARRPLSLGGLSDAELEAELKKGVDSLKANRSYTAEEVDALLNAEFGIK